MTREQYIESRVYDEHEYIDIEEATIEMLNNSYSFKKVGGPFAYMSAGDVLKDYDPCAFREEANNYSDQMVRDGKWIYFHNEFFLYEAQYLIDDITDAIRDVDPFQVDDPDHHPGWYYYDDMALCQGPFADAEACYNHACLEYPLEPVGPICE
jgi:hypothetical protein